MAKIATEGGGWRGAAERWLQGLGYPAACIETPMSGFVDEWWRYYRSEARLTPSRCAAARRRAWCARTWPA